ncbi:unnamed protein product [Allacma fusca]|uniref:Sodefrin-like factor n=1 Tax=Allacma fusca TaxID=39272 RepID=A0A8J2PI38_9HEXA|nr:unnamed protein product [Allacma fusca]
MGYGILTFTLSLVFLHLCINDCAGESSSVDELGPRSKKTQLPNNLTCFVCHSEKVSECQNVTQNNGSLAKTCSSNDTYCMVKRISFSTSQNSNASAVQPQFVAVKRNCTTKCDPGCVIMGERTRLYVCSTCCQRDLCNDGNGAGDTRPSKFSPLLIVPVALTSLGFLPTLPHHNVS